MVSGLGKEEEELCTSREGGLRGRVFSSELSDTKSFDSLTIKGFEGVNGGVAPCEGLVFFNGEGGVLAFAGLMFAEEFCVIAAPTEPKESVRERGEDFLLFDVEKC